MLSQANFRNNELNSDNNNNNNDLQVIGYSVSKIYKNESFESQENSDEKHLVPHNGNTDLLIDRFGNFIITVYMNNIY